MAIGLNSTIKRLRLTSFYKPKLQLEIQKSNWLIFKKIVKQGLAKRGKASLECYPRQLKSQNAVGIFKQVDKSPYGGIVSGKFLNGTLL
jgi:hypothetical protein